MDGTLKFSITRYGEFTTPYSFTEIQYFFFKKVWKYFSKHIKVKDMIKFDTSHILAENSVNSVMCFFWALLRAAKSEIRQKMSMFKQLKNQVLLNSRPLSKKILM